MSIRILFLGTGPLALPTFQSLCESTTHQLVGLVTQPDRTGRGHHQHVNPLKELAISKGLVVLQPDVIKTPESVAALRETQADLFVVAAYGQMLSKSVLEIPRLGTINVHASLLPKYRGATPISTSIGPVETTGQLEQRLADIAVPLTNRVIDEIANGIATRTPQDEALVTHVRKLSKIDGLVPWSKSAIEVERHVRGMQPWPGSFSHLNQPEKPSLRLQVLSVKIVDAVTSANHQPPGTVIEVTPIDFAVKCGSGAVRLLTVQPDGKKAMPTSDFLRGRKVSVGDTLA